MTNVSNLNIFYFNFMFFIKILRQTSIYFVPLASYYDISKLKNKHSYQQPIKTVDRQEDGLINIRKMSKIIIN